MSDSERGGTPVGPVGSFDTEVVARGAPNDRPPNFRMVNGLLCPVRCFVCDPEEGRENWAPAAAAGKCAWCGWEE